MCITWFVYHVVYHAVCEPFVLEEVSNIIFLRACPDNIRHLVASRHLKHINDITLRDTTLATPIAPCTRKYHAVQLNAIHLSAYD